MPFVQRTLAEHRKRCKRSDGQWAPSTSRRRWFGRLEMALHCRWYYHIVRRGRYLVRTLDY